MISRAWYINGDQHGQYVQWSDTCLYGGQSSYLRGPSAWTEPRVYGVNVKAEVAGMLRSYLVPDLLHRTDKRLVPALLGLH